MTLPAANLAHAPAPRIEEADAEVRVVVEQLRVVGVRFQLQPAHTSSARSGLGVLACRVSTNWPFTCPVVFAVLVEQEVVPVERQVTQVVGAEIEIEVAVERLLVRPVVVDAANRAAEADSGEPPAGQSRDLVKPALEPAFFDLLDVGQFLDGRGAGRPAIADALPADRAAGRPGPA